MLLPKRGPSQIRASDIVLQDAGYRTWKDGTYAESCLGYLQPTNGKAYQGDTGDGYYMIQPAGQPEFKAYCDMTFDGGGWTAIVSSGPTTAAANYGVTSGTACDPITTGVCWSIPYRYLPIASGMRIDGSSQQFTAPNAEMVRISFDVAPAYRGETMYTILNGALGNNLAIATTRTYAFMNGHSNYWSGRDLDHFLYGTSPVIARDTGSSFFSLIGGNWPNNCGLFMVNWTSQCSASFYWPAYTKLWIR